MGEDKDAGARHANALNHHAKIARQYAVDMQEHIKHRKSDRTPAFGSEAGDERAGNHHRRVVPVSEPKPDTVEIDE